jgi:hypothetical protein
MKLASNIARIDIFELIQVRRHNGLLLSTFNQQESKI